MATISDYGKYDALGLAALVRKGDVSPTELLEEALSRAEKVNPVLNALCHLVPDRARAAIAAGLPDGPFHGVPFLLKDLGGEAIGYPTSSGSRFFADYHWTYDSELWVRLRATGLVAFGRTTSPELGVGPVTEGKVYGGPTRSPWNTDRTAGGSSGGTGAAVAAGILPMAHGSDGGGSIRIPASCCGLIGLKGTRARIPDGPGSGEGWGGMSIEGVLSRTVRDTAAALDATHGPDLGAPYWAPPFEGSYREGIDRPPERLRIAVCKTDFLGEPIHAECRQAVENAAKLCADLGHEIVEARPAFDFNGAMKAWTTVVAVGTSLSIQEKANAIGRDPTEDELEITIRGAWQLGKTIPGTEYLKSINKVHATGRDMARFFVDHDLLLTPTLSEPPAAIGRFALNNPDFLDLRLGPKGIVHYSPFAPIFNITGQPAITVPLHWTRDGLPVGLHFAGRFGEEMTLLKLAAQLEQAQPWFDRRPPVSA
jgi:amidase/6-aminohexanoate-cyclic-dimer hydrolase